MNEQPVIDPQFLGQPPEHLLDRALELGSLSPSTQQLLELTRNEESELGPIVDILARNPSLAAAVLRAANSSAYGQAREVGDLRRAVLVIGMQELHDVLAGTAMLSAFAVPHPLSERLATASVVAAAITRKLATRQRCATASTAYLSGLMCELGALACLAIDRGYAGLYRSTRIELERRFAAEHARYGTTSAELGSRILAASALPTEVSEAVAATGNEVDVELSPLPRTVAFARAATTLLLASLAHDNPERLSADLSELAAHLRLDDADPELLTHVCLQAAASAAQLPLPPKLGTLNAKGYDEQLPPSAPAAERPKRRWLWITLGMSAGAIAWWLTTRA